MNSSQTHLLQTSSIILQVFRMSNDSQRQPIFMKFSNFLLYGGLSLQNQALNSVRLSHWFIFISQSIKIVKSVPWEIRHFYNLFQERISKSHWKIFEKCIELQFLLFETLFCFFLFWWRDKYQRNEKFNCFFPVTKGDKV